MAHGGPPKRDLCVYMAEAGDKGVSEETIQLIIRCLQDKMFSGNADTVCVARDDQAVPLEFVELSWTLLRRVEMSFREPRRDDSKPNLPGAVTSIMESLSVQAEEDAYTDQKILYFTNLMSDLDTGKLRELVTALGATSIFLSIIYPDKNNLNFNQIDQMELLNHVFLHLKTVYIASLPEIRKLLTNTLSKKAKRSTAWTVDLEIGPLTIGVQSYIKCRSNKSADLKTALNKDVSCFGDISSQPISSDPSRASGPIVDPEEAAVIGGEASRDLVLASEAMEKETIWTQEDGAAVDAGNVIPAYYYGDRLVTFDDAEQEFQYRSGDKCLKVLLFTGRENIWPAFIIGDGCDIVVANPKDPGADLKLNALVRALHNSKRVAIVRKVRLNNAKLALGVLAPDIEKGCLVYSQLCFADDISCPWLAPLVKEEELESGEEGLTEKEALMDELILGMSLDEYALEAGPVDPAVQVMRNFITSKALGKGPEALKGPDNIDLFFEGVVWREEVLDRAGKTFPLKELRVKSMERPSGAQIFKKREALEAIEAGNGHEDKKVKLEEVEGPLLPLAADDDDDFDFS